MTLFTDVVSSTAIPTRRGGTAEALLEVQEPEEAVPSQRHAYFFESVGNLTAIEGQLFMVTPVLVWVSPKEGYLTFQTYLAPQLQSAVTMDLPWEVSRRAVRWIGTEENVTSPSERIATVEEEALFMLEGLVAEELEDGMTASLGSKLFLLVSKYGEPAILAIASIISSGKIAPEVISHTLRWLGRMNHPATLRRRLWLLKNCLLSSSAIVRDGAALGLAVLGSPLAIPALRAAIKRERFRGLRRDMEQILELLERRA